MRPATIAVTPGSFEAERHFYPRVLNAHTHPLVRYFLSLGNDRVAKRYCHLHPEARCDAVRAALATPARYFRWAGCDLFHVTTDRGARHVVVIETNSSPSGQKSMPRVDTQQPESNYVQLLEQAFLPLLRRRSLPAGGLAVLYDKNEMEASGYAAALAGLTGEDVQLVPFPDAAGDERALARFDDGVLQVAAGSKTWEPMRAAFRYVTQRPWSRIPPLTKSAVFNPVLVCLAGGRNKLLAAKAYDLFNAELQRDGLRIMTPETMWDVSRAEVPLWVRRMGGVAVVKVPYANAGQGVYTITSEAELQAFMDAEQHYERFIVQALIGNSGWSSRGSQGCLYHVGTIPSQKGEIHVADLRFMLGGGPEGFFPVAIYARRAREALTDELAEGTSSWSMLGTNLSVKADDGWHTESERLLLMDNRDYNQLGLGLDDLIEAYMQTVLATTAIDRMASTLVTQKGKFRRRVFTALNPDPSLLQEICE